MKKIGLHVLRAATATNTLEREADIALVPESLGLGCGEHYKRSTQVPTQGLAAFKFSY